MIQTYLTGYFLSLILSVAAFVGARSLYTLSGLALLQAFVQLVFFLHVGQEKKPKWKTLLFLFMVLVVLIVVLGSLWIMFDLHHRMGHG